MSDEVNPQNNNGENLAKKGVEKLEEKGKEKAQELAKKTIQKASKKATKTAAKVAAKSSLMAALSTILVWVVIVIVILVIIIGIIMFLATMPGMVMNNLKKIAKELGNSWSSWWGADSTEFVDDEKIYETLDYLEQMGYDLKGFGFLTDYVTKYNKDSIVDKNLENIVSSGEYKADDDLGVFRNKDSDNIIYAQSAFIYQYLVSENYMYTIKNFNTVSGGWIAFWDHMEDIFGGTTMDEGKKRGMLAIYHEDKVGNDDDITWQEGSEYKEAEAGYIKTNAEEQTLEIKRGWFTNTMKFNLDGWTGRYGMPLDFLISVHLATMMPDLAYDMATSFATEVQILLHNSTGEKIESAYKTDTGEYITYSQIKDKRGDVGTNNKEALEIMQEYGIHSITTDGSPYKCIGQADTTVVLWSPKSSDIGETLGNSYDEERIQNLIEEKELQEAYTNGTITSWSTWYDTYITNCVNVGLDNNGTNGIGYYNTFNGYSGGINNLKKLITYIKDAWDVGNTEAGTTDECPFASYTNEVEACKAFDDIEMTLDKFISMSEDQYTDFNLKTWTKEYDGETKNITLQVKVHKTSIDTNIDFDVILYRDMSNKEIEDNNIIVDGNYQCSEDKTRKKCCDNCQEYVKRIFSYLKDSNDFNFNTYIPYIKQVTNHWFRDVYFVTNKSDNLKFIEYDVEYEAIMKERWTLYETNDEGDYKLYEINDDGSYGGVFVGTQEDANEKGIKVAKKALTNTIENIYETAGWNTTDSENYSAYSSTTITKSSGYLPVYEGDTDIIKSRIYYNRTQNSDIEQTGEGLRTETNSDIKKMFLSNTYFRYDGSRETAEIISALRKHNNIDYGPLSEGDLDKTVEVKDQKYDGKEIAASDGTYKVSDYSGQVSLNQDSLNAFSMLENTHTLDADYIYRDFKELVVELGYFEKEELTDETPKLLQWLVPEIGSGGFPNSSIDKNENEFGTMVHSENDIQANVKNTIRYLIESTENLTPEAGLAADETEEIGLLDEKTFNKKDLSTKVASLDASSINVHTNVGSIAEVPETAIDTSGMYSEEELANVAQVCQGGSYHPDRGKETGVMIINGVSYVGWFQTDATCTLNAFAFVAQAYTGEPIDTYLRDSSGNIICNDSLGPQCKKTTNDFWLPGLIEPKTGFSQLGISGTNYKGYNQDEQVQAVAKGLAEGKPIYVYGSFLDKEGNINGGPHAFVLLGRTGNKVVYYDPFGGTIKWLGVESNSFEQNLRKVIGTIDSHIFIPDEIPTGVNISSSGNGGNPYIGYKGGEAVVSPVTGILLDYGTYTSEDKDSATGEEYRVNTDLKYPNLISTGDESEKSAVEGSETTKGKIVSDKVGYAKILVLDNENYQKLESQTSNNWKSNSLLKSSGGYKEDLKKEEDLEDLSDLNKTVYGYKEFAERYEQFGIDGYVIYIDGFKAELPVESEEDSADDASGEKLTKDSFKNAINTSKLDGSGNLKNEDDQIKSLYKRDEEYKTVSETVTNKLNAESEVKDQALSTFSIGDTIFIKEGTVLGTTYTNEEIVTMRGESYSEDNDEVIGNYLRIIMRDLDDTVVENVEEYMKLDEERDDGNGSLNKFPGDTVQEKVWNALVDAGYSKYAIVGVMGNIYGESCFDPSAIESTGEGYGLCQWSYGRKSQLLEFANSRGVDWTDADLQIEFLLAEITPGGGADGYATYQFLTDSARTDWENATSVEEATTAFCAGFERPGNPRNQVRIDAAQKYYDTYGS